MKRPVLVLASNSPRRRELLALAAWEFAVQPAEVDETPLPGEAPGRYVLRLAESKARACASTRLSTGASTRLSTGASTSSRPGAQSAGPGELILAADTTVALEGEILGKPAGPREATAMLRRLRGRSHQVHTGLALLSPSDGCLVTDLCTSEVPMRAYGEEELAAYVASGDPLDKAGAYAIQHAGFHPVGDFSGCFASVMGLPLCHLQRSLKKMGLEADLPARCQSHLSYACPVSADVLSGRAAG